MPHTESWLKGPSSTSFYTRLYTPTLPVRGAVIFVHGYMEHVGRYTAIHELWASSGFAVFTYDQRGFGRTALDNPARSTAYGETGGMEERMCDVEWAVLHAKEVLGDGTPLFLMGHSMGGGIVLGLATRSECPPSKDTVALLSGVIASSPLICAARGPPGLPALKVLGILRKRFPNVPIKTPLFAAGLSHDPKVGQDSLSDPWIRPVGTLGGLADMIIRGTQLSTDGYKNWPQFLPVLILQGTADRVSSYPVTKRFSETLEAPDKQYIEYHGMFHDLMTEPEVKERYFEDCVSWVEKHLSS